MSYRCRTSQRGLNAAATAIQHASLMPEGRVAVTWEVPGASEKGGLSSTSARLGRIQLKTRRHLTSSKLGRWPPLKPTPYTTLHSGSVPVLVPQWMRATPG